jgi:ribosomal protein S18 acetylase RimI-like enzyme
MIDVSRAGKMSPPLRTISQATVRPIRPGDREPILQLVRSTGFFSDEEVAIAAELVDVVLQRPEQKDYLICTCEEEGTVLGYYCIGPTPATASTYDLYWIAVRPDVQGRGVGTILNRHAEELVKSRGGRLMIAETSSQPRYEGTRAFYLNRGYSELARIRDYYRAGDDLIVYGKYFS